MSTKPGLHAPRPSSRVGSAGTRSGNGSSQLCAQHQLPASLHTPAARTTPAFPPQTREESSPRRHCGITGVWEGRTQLQKPLGEQEKRSRQGDAGRRSHSTGEPFRAHYPAPAITPLPYPVLGEGWAGSCNHHQLQQPHQGPPRASLPGLPALPIKPRVLDSVFNRVSKCLNPGNEQSSSIPTQAAPPSTKSDHDRAQSQGMVPGHGQGPTRVQESVSGGCQVPQPPVPRSRQGPKEAWSPLPSLPPAAEHHLLSQSVGDINVCLRKWLLHTRVLPAPLPCFSISELWQISD